MGASNRPSYRLASGRWSGTTSSPAAGSAVVESSASAGATTGGRRIATSRRYTSSETTRLEWPRGTTTADAPGSRVPYAWLDAATSTIDCVAGGFALLAGPEGERWTDALPGIAFSTAMLPHETLHRFGIGPSGALLVRPDGFVAWRAESDIEACSGTMGRVLAAALATWEHPSKRL